MNPTNATPTPLDARRRRALALMGIDVYRLRSGDAGGPDVADAPAALVVPPGRPTAADILPPRLRIALDAAAGDPRRGPHATLLAQIVKALGLATGEVAFEELGESDLPLLCFGVAPPAAAQAHGLAPLAAVRQGPAVKRSLWRTLRPLRRRFRPA